MKVTLKVVFLLALGAPVFADQAAESFATGFANGFNQALYGQQNTNNTQQVNVTQRQYQARPYKQEPHYDIQATWGLRGLWFPSYQACQRDAQGEECVLVQ